MLSHAISYGWFGSFMVRYVDLKELIDADSLSFYPSSLKILLSQNSRRLNILTLYIFSTFMFFLFTFVFCI